MFILYIYHIEHCRNNKLMLHSSLDSRLTNLVLHCTVLLFFRNISSVSMSSMGEELSNYVLGYVRDSSAEYTLRVCNLYNIALSYTTVLNSFFHAFPLKVHRGFENVHRICNAVTEMSRLP